VRDNQVSNEVRVVAQDMLRLGNRVMQAGRSWLNERRSEMANRYNEYRNNEYRNTEYGSDEHWGGDNRNAASGADRPGRYGQSGQARPTQSYAPDYAHDREPQYRAARSSSDDDYQRYGYQSQGRGYEQGWDDASDMNRGGPDWSRAQSTGRQGQERDEAPYARQPYGTPRYAEQGHRDDGHDPGFATGSSHGGARFDAQHQGRYAQQSLYGQHAGFNEPSHYGQVAEGAAGSRSFGGTSAGLGVRAGQQAYSSAPGYGSAQYGDAAGRAGYGAEFGRSAPPQGFRGRGPKNYARSDERIIDDISERLTQDDYIDASDIEVRCEQGKLVLDGTVEQRWMKHRAEDLADAVSGVKSVENRIRVDATRGTPSGVSAQSPLGSSTLQSSATAGRGAAAGAASKPGTNTPGPATPGATGGTASH